MKRRLRLKVETLRMLVLDSKRDLSARPSYCRCSGGEPCTATREGCP